MTEADEPLDNAEDIIAPRPAYGTTRAPRATRLTRADVLQAAGAVLIAGGRVTIDRVRGHLGRGSPNTIREHLDTWWSKLGSRLRDIPGREFPQLPEDVATALPGLWNTALDSAYAAIDCNAAAREAELTEREAAITVRDAQFVEQSQAIAACDAALEGSLQLAREHLTATNTRADRLETLLQAREAEAERWRVRADAVEAEGRELRENLDAATHAHQAERDKLNERNAANEARWLVEIDRGRQTAKEAAKENERQLELRAQITQFQTQRPDFKRELQEARAQLRTAVFACTSGKTDRGDGSQIRQGITRDPQEIPLSAQPCRIAPRAFGSREASTMRTGRTTPSALSSALPSQESRTYRNPVVFARQEQLDDAFPLPMATLSACRHDSFRPILYCRRRDEYAAESAKISRCGLS